MAQLSFSWTAPLDVRRVPPTENAHAVAVAQIRTLLSRQPVGAPVPLCVFDAGYDGYDPETLARELGDLDGERVAVLVRLRSGRCFYADPPPPVGSQVGRPRRHGAQFACDDEQTLTCPDRYLDARHEVMTSYQSQEAAPDVLRRGASGVRLKPFRSAELREVMARRAGAAGHSAEKRFR